MWWRIVCAHNSKQHVCNHIIRQTNCAFRLTDLLRGRGKLSSACVAQPLTCLPAPCRLKGPPHEGIIKLVNKVPKWNASLGAYCLNFNGRVTQVRATLLVMFPSQCHPADYFRLCWTSTAKSPLR